jgi:AcrR family transcriptional regulator
MLTKLHQFGKVKYMGSKERRARHKLFLQNAILTSAKKVANEEGWEAVTMRRIADEIEYTLPVIYSHFDSKDKIIISIANSGFKLLLDQIKAKVATSKGTVEKAVEEIALEYCKFASDEPALYEAMYGKVGISALSTEESPEGQELFNYIHEHIITLGKDNKLTIANPWAETKLFWSTLHGLLMLDDIGRISDTNSTLEDIVKIFVAGRVAMWKK